MLHYRFKQIRRFKTDRLYKLTCSFCLAFAIAALAHQITIAPATGQIEGTSMVVTTKENNQIFLLDAETGKRLGSVTTGDRPHEVVVTPDRQLAVASLFGTGIYGDNPNPNNQLGIIDLTTMQESRFDLGRYQAPHGLAMTDDGLVWVTVENNQSVLLVDPKQKQILSEIPVDANAHYIVLSPDGRRAYTSNKEYPFISVINTEQRKTLAPITLPRGAQGIAISPDGTRLYVGDFNQQFLQVIDVDTQQIVKQVPLQAQPGWVHVTSDSSKVLISTYDKQNEQGYVEVIAANTLEPIGVVEMPTEAFRMDSTSDNRYAFVALADGSIPKLDLEQLQIIDTFKLDPLAETIVLLD